MSINLYSNYAPVQFLGSTIQLLIIGKGAPGNYEVVEGNRRLAAVKLLQNPQITKVQGTKVKYVYDNAKFHPESIPCLIFDDKNEILKYLGYRHVTGIKPWKSLEKARYLDGLTNTLGVMSFEQKCIELAKMIGSRNDYTRRILIGFRIYKYIEEQRFFDIPGLNDTTFFFANLTDSLNRPNIASFLGVSSVSEYVPEQSLKFDNIKEWTKWLYQRNDQNQTRLIGSSEKLGSLNSIIANEGALSAFKNGKTLEDALLLTEDVEKMFCAEIQKAINALTQADSVTQKIKNYYAELDSDLQNIFSLCKKIRAVKEAQKEQDDEL